jgi:tetratricopeptide (TPR) repeat protein
LDPKGGIMNPNKMTITVIFLVFLFVPMGYANDISDSVDAKLKAAKRYLEGVSIATITDNIINEMAQRIPPDKRDDFLRFTKNVNKSVTIELLEKVTIESLVKVFTVEELNALAEFYGSKVGRSVMNKFGVYTAEAMSAIQQEIMRRFQELEREGYFKEYEERRDAETYFNRGGLYYKGGEYDQAISDFNKALEVNPNYAYAYRNRGNAYSSKGQDDQAILDYGRALEVNPRDALAYYNRGNAYGRKGQYDQAISDYNKALEINPRDALAYYNRGNAYDRKGRYDQAISDFNKAIEINPRYAEAYGNRGNAYSRKGQYDQAVSDFTKVLEINPGYARAYVSRGLTYYRKGEYDLAIMDYNRAIDINPQFVRAYNNLAWLFATAKEAGFRNGEKALELALKACELSNWSDPYHLGTLAAAYARTGDFENAIKWQGRALESPVFAKDKEAQQQLNLYRSHKAWPPD